MQKLVLINNFWFQVHAAIKQFTFTDTWDFRKGKDFHPEQIKICEKQNFKIPAIRSSNDWKHIRVDLIKKYHKMSKMKRWISNRVVLKHGSRFRIFNNLSYFSMTIFFKKSETRFLASNRSRYYFLNLLT